MIKEKDIIDNRYEVNKVYASEKLYEVIDVRMRTEWMMKEISITEVSVEEIVKKLEQVKRMNHRFFPKITEIIRKDNSILVIMEKINGIHADQIAKKRCHTREVINWALQICDGLSYMEQSAVDTKCILWKYDVKNILIEGSSVRVQDFDLFFYSVTEDRKTLSSIGNFIIAMFSEKVPGKLKKIVADCMASKFSDYQELEEALERYILEQAKIKRWKKRGSIVASAMLLLLVVGIVGMNSIKVLSERKEKKETKISAVVPSKTVEDTKLNVTKQPEDNPTTTLPSPEPEKNTKKPYISSTPIVTEKPKEKISKTKAPIERPTIITNPPVITAKPKTRERVEPRKRVTERPRITKKPKIKKKPKSVDVELEDNKMDVIVK